MQLDIRDRSFTVDDSHERFWTRVSSGQWEPGLFDVIDRYVTDDTIMLDMGAYIGAVTLYASNCAEKVFAFEPNPAAFKWLEKNVEYNKCENVEAVNKGVSTHTREAQLRLVSEPDNPMNTLVGASDDDFGNADVELLDIYQIVKNTEGKKIFVKIDTEGHEYDLVPACSKILSRQDATVHLSTHSSYHSFLVNSGSGLHHSVFRRTHRLVKKPSIGPPPLTV